MPFTGLMVGCSKQFWLDILRKLSTIEGSDGFTWYVAYAKFPEIDKSQLSRLSRSEFIIKSGFKGRNTQAWKLHPDCQIYLNRPFKRKKH